MRDVLGGENPFSSFVASPWDHDDSVLISVAKRLLLFAKELTVSNTNEAAMTAAESPQFWSGSATPDKNPLYFLTLHAVPSKLSGRAQ